MNAVEKIALLFAKIGVFFANCDGQYDEREKAFIARYISQLKQLEEMSDDGINLIESVLDTKFTFDEIVKDTHDLFSHLNQVEKKAVLANFEEFISSVINADGIVHPKEAEYFALWKKKFED